MKYLQFLSLSGRVGFSTASGGVSAANVDAVDESCEFASLSGRLGFSASRGGVSDCAADAHGVAKSAKSAFTIIELIFTIIIIGILAAVALPKFGGILGAKEAVKLEKDVLRVRMGVAYLHKKITFAPTSTWSTIGASASGFPDGLCADKSGRLIAKFRACTAAEKPFNALPGEHKFTRDGGRWAREIYGGRLYFAYESATGQFYCSGWSAEREQLAERENLCKKIGQKS